MGQTIDVKSVVFGEVALFDTDRTVTGQDGNGFASGATARGGTTTAARLATALFGSDPAIDHVFVMSNQVTVRRTDAWNDQTIAGAADVIRDFFIFYDENRGAAAPPAGD
jgi:hypothetical protein